MFGLKKNNITYLYINYRNILKSFTFLFYSLLILLSVLIVSAKNTQAGGGLPIRKFVDTKTQTPGSVGPFSIINSPVSVGGGEKAFKATELQHSGIYTKGGSTLQKIADIFTAIPHGNGNFASFGSP